MGQNGGAVFLLTFVFFILTICFIPMMTEILFGKITKKECIGAFERVNPKFKYIGMLNPLTAIIVPSFYFVIGGWIINYLYKSFIGFKAPDYAQYLNSFVQAPVITTFLTLCFLFVCIFFLARGVKKGIEFVNNITMPILAILLVGLAFSSLQLPNAQLGLEYIFKPDWSKFNAQMVLAALGQAFFTISVGMGNLLTYGSYIKEDKNLAKSTYTIILASMTFSLLAGIMIFPAVFSFGFEPNCGAGLVFVTLPKVFAQIPYGDFVAGIFFILLFCAAITSGIGMLEVPCATLIERFKLSRVRASALLFVIIATLAVPSTLSFGILRDFKLFNKTIFELFDFAASNIMLPLNTLLLCVIAGWFLKIDGKMITKNPIFAYCFTFGLKYIIPIFLLILMIFGLK